MKTLLGRFVLGLAVLSAPALLIGCGEGETTPAPAPAAPAAAPAAPEGAPAAPAAPAEAPAAAK